MNPKATHPHTSHRVRETAESVRNIGHDPHIDWAIIIISSIILSALLIAAGFYVYTRTSAQLSTGAGANTSAQLPINAQMLSGVLEQFDTRSRERTEIIKGQYKLPADPSL